MVTHACLGQLNESSSYGYLFRNEQRRGNGLQQLAYVVRFARHLLFIAGLLLYLFLSFQCTVKSFLNIPLLRDTGDITQAPSLVGNREVALHRATRRYALH